MRTITLILAAMAMMIVGAAAQENPVKSDNEIRQILIQQSRARYAGSCPCPYNVDRGGRRCGGRSAYSRAGGASPLCYEEDITDEMVQSYRARMN